MSPHMAVLALSLAAWPLLGSCRGGRPKAVGYEEPPPDGALVTCPVSGARCEKGARTAAAVYEMRTFYFCDEVSRVRFVDDPERYADARSPGP